jgi:hypothetical protein
VTSYSHVQKTTSSMSGSRTMANVWGHIMDIMGQFGLLMSIVSRVTVLFSSAISSMNHYYCLKHCHDLWYLAPPTILSDYGRLRMGNVYTLGSSQRQWRGLHSATMESKLFVLRNNGWDISVPSECLISSGKAMERTVSFYLPFIIFSLSDMLARLRIRNSGASFLPHRL